MQLRMLSVVAAGFGLCRAHLFLGWLTVLQRQEKSKMILHSPDFPGNNKQTPQGRFTHRKSGKKQMILALK